MALRVVIINDFSSGGGGAAALATLSARELVRRGVDVLFIAGDDATLSSELDVGSGATVPTLSLRGKSLLESPVAGIVTGLFDIRARNTIGEWVQSNDTPETVYHLHNWSQILSPAIFSALRAVRHRVVLHAHDFFLTCPNGAYANYQEGTACELNPLSPRCLVTNCDRRSYAQKLWRVARQAVVRGIQELGWRGVPIIALHEGMVPLLARAGVPVSSIKVLRNPVVPFSPSRVRAEANREFAFVGRLHHGKGPDLAAEAAKRAGVPLRFVGDGPLRSALEHGYPAFPISGWCDRSAVSRMLGGARALVMPSRYPEPFGLVALEALWSGLPVIIAKTALLANEIKEREAGLSVDPTNVAAFAEVLSQINQSDRVVEQMSMRAYTDCRELATTTDEWIDGLLETYASVLEKQASNGTVVRRDAPDRTARL
ncbi:glycosyltransferase family 4 protein [Micromonospora sp. STR1s_5]|nr:glycosyltransferase family 4 protein [Micromonospora sp. STR1s_5]